MYTYTTTAELRAIQGSILAEQKQASLNRAATRAVSGSTFLSHSTTDSDLLPAVIAILERHGAQVYIDKKDATLPPFTNRETARGLRNRIEQSRNFVLFATKRSKDSRWMPWELGISDGVKSARKTAIFPSVDTADDYHWAEREYLGIYNRIVWGDLMGFPKEVWMVLNQEENVATELKKWLQA